MEREKILVCKTYNVNHDSEGKRYILKYDENEQKNKIIYIDDSDVLLRYNMRTDKNKIFEDSTESDSKASEIISEEQEGNERGDENENLMNHLKSLVGEKFYDDLKELIKTMIHKYAIKDKQVIIIKGERGEKGKRGDRGKEGKFGKRGEKGECGKPGEKGDIGKRGKRGEKGDKGECGKPGEKGEKGEEGKRGKPGKRGNQGECGKCGDKGEKGEWGNKGDKGDKGQPGQNIISNNTKVDNQIVPILSYVPIKQITMEKINEDDLHNRKNVINNTSNVLTPEVIPVIPKIEIIPPSNVVVAIRNIQPEPVELPKTPVINEVIERVKTPVVNDVVERAKTPVVNDVVERVKTPVVINDVVNKTEDSVDSPQKATKIVE